MHTLLALKKLEGPGQRSTGPAPTLHPLWLAHGFSVFNSRIFLDDIDVEALPQFKIVF